MADVKVSVTTVCNAHCVTCPIWKCPGQDMATENFIIMWDKLMADPKTGRVLINNTGDIYNHPERMEIFEYIETHHEKPVIMTTNAALMDYVPKLEELVISFNGGNKEAYEKTTGLDFEAVRMNIRFHYPDFAEKVKDLQMHVLIYDGNVESEKDILTTWADFPGRIRVSYKYDNQHSTDRTLPIYRRTRRIPCDYLEQLCVWPNGQIIMCAHDFKGSINWGNVFTDSMTSIWNHRERYRKKLDHIKGKFEGLCETCNYNTPTFDKLKWIK